MESMDSWADSDDDEEDDSEGGGGGGRWRRALMDEEDVEEESEHEEMAYGLFDSDVSEDEMYRYTNMEDNENGSLFSSSSEPLNVIFGFEPEENVPKEEQEVSKYL